MFLFFRLLHYAPQNQKLRNGEYGQVLGADCYSPAPLEPSHSDFTWYGIHGVETLYTVMGPGCKTVARTSTEGTDVVVGVWEDGRIGTFRGTRTGIWGYGGTAFCPKEDYPVGGYPGYEVLLTEILKFFKTKEAPIDPKETIEMFTFMDAAVVKDRKGKTVSMDEVYQKALKKANKILKNYK